MAEIFKFFNSTPNDERWHYASDFAEYFGDVLSSGLLHKDNVPGLQVTVFTSSLKTKVDTGQALIKGYSYRNTEPIELTHEITSVGMDRIDRIVLRLDLTNANRYIRVFVKKGVEATNPVPPALQRDNYIYELSLAQVRVRSNTTVVDPTSLIDERMDEGLCGIVSSLISVPTSVFQQQFDLWFNQQKVIYTDDLNAWTTNQKALFESFKNSEVALFSDWKTAQQNDFSDWRAQEKKDFEAWFASLQNILDGNVAATLTNDVTNLKSRVTTLESGYKAGRIDE